jgi:hypothetical protein
MILDSSEIPPATSNVEKMLMCSWLTNRLCCITPTASPLCVILPVAKFLPYLAQIPFNASQEENELQLSRLEKRHIIASVICCPD